MNWGAPWLKISKHLFQWEDICNVYLIADGDSGLLIDSGSGTVLDHLSDVGIERVKWVLHTHHHRDQCQGTPQLRGCGAQVAVPEYEWHHGTKCWALQGVGDVLAEPAAWASTPGLLEKSIRIDRWPTLCLARI